MPKLYSSRKVVQIIKEHNFLFVSQKGSHAKFRKQEEREIPVGTFSFILRQSQLKKEDFG